MRQKSINVKDDDVRPNIIMLKGAVIKDKLGKS